MVKFLSWLNNRITLQDPIIKPAGTADAGKIVGLNNGGMIDALAVRDRHFQRRRAEIYSDFIGGNGEWISTVSGTGSANSSTVLTTLPEGFRMAGVSNMATGTTATGRAFLGTTPTAFKLADLNSDGSYTLANFRAIFQIPLISDAVESFVCRFGFIDSSSAESSDGVFLRINANNTAQFVARNNNVESVTTVAYTFLPARTYNVEVFVSSPTLATLNIYNSPLNTEAVNLVSSVTIATNIPNASTRLTGAGTYIQKTVGIVARTIQLDYMYAGIDV